MRYVTPDDETKKRWQIRLSLADTIMEEAGIEITNFSEPLDNVAPICRGGALWTPPTPEGAINA